MKVKIIVAKPTKEDVVSSVFAIETTSKEFVTELKKYACPMRITKYLDEHNKESYTNLSDDLPNEEFELIIDLSEKFENIINENMKKGDLMSSFPEIYIKKTSHLDQYGNLFTKIDIISSLYGKDKYDNEIQKVDTDGIYYMGWYISGYKTMEELRVDFPEDYDIIELYKED